MKDNQSPVAYKTRHERLPAFELVGFTKIVKSGGELYSEARQDGRWDVLRTLAGEDGTVYGVASRDEECTKGHYRYTLAVKAAADKLEESPLRDSLFSIQIREAEWIFFVIEDFEAQYGRLWRDDPYKMIAKLGWAYNSEVGLHIDVFPPSYSAESDSMEFMMPVSRPA